MDWSAHRHLFDVAGQALDGRGGFRPALGEGSHLVRHTREGDDKFKARNALATYENHMRQACDRFAAFLGRRKPQRRGTDAPLVQAMLANADMAGRDLDSFWRQFAQQAAARGSMLLVIDRPDAEAGPGATLSEQQRLRALPYVRAAAPEDLDSYRLDAFGSAFEQVTLCGWEWIDDELREVRRDYDTTHWRLRVRRAGGPGGARPEEWPTVAEGQHGLGACPVLAFTEDGSAFPCLGRFTQIADLSRDLFNLRSELREILRAQTFNLLTLQTPEHSDGAEVARTVAATVGTHSMLVYTGERPAFIAPDPGPVEAYMGAIAAVRQEIARVAMDDAVSSGLQAESGTARRLRFDALNAALSRFSLNLQALELRMWTLFHRALGTENRVSVAWPTDYTLADVAGELDILALMQSTGFPEPVQTEKRRAIVASEFDHADDATKAALDAALNEPAQAATRGA